MRRHIYTGRQIINISSRYFFKVVEHSHNNQEGYSKSFLP